MANPIPGTMIVSDPWEQAFADYQQALVDLNGDGVPDAVVPIGNRVKQAVGRRAMAGRDPSLTPQEMEGVRRRAAISEENNQAVESGVGELLFGQPVRAGKAIGDAYNAPSLANVTNAGVQTALAVFRPMAAAKVGGAGLGAAALSDLNPFAGPAEAGPGDRDRARAAREQARAARDQAEAARAQANMERERANAERSMSEGRVKEEAERLRLAENDAAVRRAITARDAILADRPKKFSETETGKVFDKLGMIAPAIPAAIGGGLAGAGVRAAGAGHTAASLTGIGVGGLAGGLAGNWPLGHELMFARAYNPEKRAYEAGAREMPASDPRRKEWEDYARGLPDANPERQQVLNELLNIPLTVKRSAFPIAEGALAGWGAVDLPGALSRLTGRGRGTGPGNRGGPTTDQGAAPQPPQQIPRYDQLPPEARQAVRENYLTSRDLNPGTPSAAPTARAIQNSLLADANIQAPVTASRVAQTNRAYDQIVQNYMAHVGRPPTRDELMQIFNNRTLAIPAAAAAATPLNNLLALYGQEPGY